MTGVPDASDEAGSSDDDSEVAGSEPDDPGADVVAVGDVEDDLASVSDDLAAALDDLDDPAIDMAGFGSCEEALEKAVVDLERVVGERNEYLDMARRVQADFENFKRRVDTQRREITERANESLVSDLLPVLDACAAAVAAGSVDVAVIESSLKGALEKLGLSTVADAGVPFDPTVHDAVLSEPSDGSDDEMVVAEIMRIGYLWNGRVLRPAMVKVRG